MMLDQPCGNCLVQLIQQSREKMIRAVDKGKTRIPGCMGGNLFHLSPRTVLVVCPLDNQLSLAATLQIRKVRIVHWNSHSNQFLHTRIPATRPQPYPTSETEASHQQRHVGKFFRQEFDGRLHVSSLS